MTLYVDHQARRNQILETAFALFAQEGYDGVTYRKIAVSCNISRTTIYKYFKDKEQIFNYAIHQATDKISRTVQKVMDRSDLAPDGKIRRVLHLTLKLLAENRVFLTVVLDYLITQKQAGNNVRRIVRRHTFGMRILLSRLVQDASETGLFRAVDSEKAAGRLYGLLESFVLNLTVLDALNWKDCLSLIDETVDDLMTAEKGEKKGEGAKSHD